MTLLGLDIGDKWIGLAILRSGTVPVPFGTIKRGKGKAEEEIGALIRSERVEKVIIGLPLDEKGGETLQSKKIQSFCRRLQRRIDNVSFIFIDEYGSSDEAKKRLGKVKSTEAQKKQRGIEDSVSASIILEWYLNVNSGSE